MHVSLPPIRRREFWAVQGLVFAIAATHTFLETIGRLHLPEPLYLIPTSLFFIPVVYAALAFGVRGSVPTALWSIALTLPNILFLHHGIDRLGIVWQLGILLAVAVFVGLRVDRERLARAEAEARERERQASEERYQALFDGSAEAVFVIDEDGFIEEANEAAATLLGIPLDRLQGRVAVDVLGPWIVASVVGGEPSEGPIALPRAPDAPMVWVEVLASQPLLDSGGVRHVQGILHDVTLRYERQKGLEGYARRVVAAREEERRRIGREIHDGPLQSLMLVSRMLGDVERGVAPGRVGAAAVVPADGARGVLEGAADELRRISRALRPSILDDLGLVPALRSEATALSRRAGLHVGFGTLGIARRLAPEVELMLLRVTQEALHNVERHARASRVSVRLAFGRDRAYLVIRDDGGGLGALPSAAELLTSGKLGLVGMEERARLMGAEFLARAAPSGGTSIIVAVPTSVVDGVVA